MKIVHRGRAVLVRTLSTTAAPSPSPSLHRRLSEIPATGGTVTGTVNSYIREGKVIEKYELERCVRSLRNHRRFLHALQVMEWMEVRNVNFSYKDLAIRLDLIAKAWGIDAAENCFNALAPLEKNKFTYGSLLNCYCQEKMEEKALSLFQQMDDIGVTSTLAFNNLISLYMKLGQPEKVPKLVNEIRVRNIPLQTFTYNVLMHSYACVGDIEGMERVYEEMMRENNNSCDWTTYSNLALQYIKAGYPDRASFALKLLEEKMGPRDRPAHHFLISLHASISNLEEVHRIWNLLKSGFPKLINADYIVTLQALEKLSDVDGMKRLYSEWKLSGTVFDVRITNIAVKFYLKMDMIIEAETILHEAMKRSKGPFFKSLELFVEFYLRERNIVGAVKCLEEAAYRVKDGEWKPKPEYSDKLLEYFEEERDVSCVEKLCKILERIKCSDSRVYLSLFHTYKVSGDHIDDVRKRMEDGGIEMNVELDNLLQSVYQKWKMRPQIPSPWQRILQLLKVRTIHLPIFL